MPDNTSDPASPCVKICRIVKNLLTKQDYCAGCGRTRSEIARWPEIGALEKRRIIRAASARLSKPRG